MSEMHAGILCAVMMLSLCAALHGCLCAFCYKIPRAGDLPAYADCWVRIVERPDFPSGHSFLSERLSVGGADRAAFHPEWNDADPAIAMDWSARLANFHQGKLRSAACRAVLCLRKRQAAPDESPDG